MTLWRLGPEPSSTGSQRREVHTMAKNSGKPGKAALSKAGKKLASDSTSKAGKSKAGSTLGKG